ncbi:MAG: CPBP family intramembrane glutamic endopeptidase [Crocinitomicaceae bacterium]
MLKKNNLYILGLITLLGFPLIGFGINMIFEGRAKIELLNLSSDSWISIIAGILFGISFAMVAERMSEIPFISRSTYDLTQFFQGLNLNLFDIFFLAFSTGFGEEILFRGAIQGQLGIWLTSILFIAIHGYLNPKNIGMFLFGVFLVLFSAFMGYLFEQHGIWSSIMAHFSYDFILLYSLRKSTKKFT